MLLRADQQQVDPLEMGANGNSKKVSSALSGSPAVPLSHHPPKGHRQMQACRKPTNPPAFHKQPSCPQLPACSHPDNSMLWVVSEHQASRRAEISSDGQELFFTQLTFCSLFSLLFPNMKILWSFTSPLSHVSCLPQRCCSFSARPYRYPGPAVNNPCKQMGFAQTVPRVLLISFFPWTQGLLIPKVIIDTACSISFSFLC